MISGRLHHQPIRSSDWWYHVREDRYFIPKSIPWEVKLPSATIAYIAGFLDGDGSIMFQLKRRSDTIVGWRFMATVVLYQDSRHESPLLGIRRQLGIGYVSRRRDGMTEVRIQGFRQVHDTLCVLLPHLRFKRAQAKAVVSACALLARTRIAAMTRRQKERVARCLMTVQEHNYATRRKKSMNELQRIIGLTP